VTFKIRYIDFWPSFQPETFIFTKIVEKYITSDFRIVYNKNEKVDLQFHSVFTFKSTAEKVKLFALSKMSEKHRIDYFLRTSNSHSDLEKNPSKYKVWFTGENRRPPVGLFDATLSFDSTDLKLNNLYFPYWMCRINWNIGSSGYEMMPSIQQLMQKRDLVVKDKTCCSFSSQVDLLRDRIILSIEEQMTVDKYGSRYERRVESKFDVSKQYGFQVCPENDLYPGYVTEKLQEAWLANNIPIWAGLQTIEYFNPDAFLDVTGRNTEEINRVFKDLDTERIARMRSEPILILEPSLNPIVELLSDISK
jgi:hypothetical protein